MTSNAPSSIGLMSLPKDLQRHIFSFLTPKDARLARVSRHFHGLFNERSFWLRHFQNHFPELFSTLDSTSVTLWSKKFNEATQTSYQGLTPTVASFFYDAKENINHDILKRLRRKQLTKQDAHGNELVDIASNRDNFQLLTRIYQLAKNYFQDDSTKVNENNDDQFQYAILCAQPTSELTRLVGLGFTIESPHYLYHPLHIAASNGYLEQMQFLLDHLVNIDLLTGQRWSALGIASHYNHPACVKLLLARGAKVDFLNAGSHQITALATAARKGNIDCMRLLLTHNADVNLADNQGQTPLYLAAINDQYDCVSLLLQHKAQMQCEHDSPLCAMVRQNNLPILRQLLHHGALNTETNHAAILFAIAHRHHDCIIALLDYGQTLHISYKANIKCFTEIIHQTKHESQIARLFAFVENPQHRKQDRVDLITVAEIFGCETTSEFMREQHRQRMTSDNIETVRPTF